MSIQGGALSAPSRHRIVAACHSMVDVHRGQKRDKQAYAQVEGHLARAV